LLLQNAQIQGVETLESDIRNIFDESTRTKSNSNTDHQQHQQQHPDYSTNPTITTTALAHSLWSYVLRPGIDIAIDATAGNGYDALAIAKMLFPKYVLLCSSSTNDTTYDGSKDDMVITTTTTTTQSMLYAIDIQLTACQNTTERLSSILPPHIMSNHVQIWHTSHETLPIPLTNNDNVALIVYNLGFLPGSHSKENNKSITTKTITTITSLGNAVSLLRVGGMLSVTTYPRTNHQEDIAVQVFMETLALFSSQTQSWMEYLEGVHLHHHKNDDDHANTGDSRDNISELSEHLIQTLQQVYDDNPYQKWRVTQHKKLGRIDAPILFTAVRIQ
jgi:Putative rRNA methylase